MAQNQGGDGKGHSKFRTAEEDAADRRAAKARRRGRGKGFTPDPNGTVLDAARMDRAVGVTAAALGVQRQREMRTKAYETTLVHLISFGEKMVKLPGKPDLRPRWVANAQAAAAELLRLYFFGTPIEIQTQELRMGQRVIDEVRRRFAGACYFNDRIEDTPGQELEWFEEAYAAAVEFHTKRKAAKAAAQTQAGNQTAEAAAEAGAEKVLVNA